ncbi:hypothetical protein [Pseudorhodoplanes sp.]|uniref:hypothetical protein n=1 Tax=Pseudorhodoplanes sp. TaxID=1934341 RepID=UPI00391B2DC3
MDDTSGGDEIVYAYKATLMGGAWVLRLAPDALLWSLGAMSGRVPYRDIRRIRLGFRPVTMQSYRFLAEIWADKSPKIQIASASWKSLLEQERQDAAYVRFIKALHARIREAGGTPHLTAGAIPFLYWPGFVIFAGICIAMLALIFRAIQQGEMTATLFLLGFFAVLLWQLGMFFKRNLPRRYTLDAIPADILPTPAKPEPTPPG